MVGQFNGNGNGNGVGLKIRPELDLRFRNYTVTGTPGDEVIEGRDIGVLLQELLAIGNEWPKKVGDQLVVFDAAGRPIWLDSSSKLFAWIDGRQKIDWKKGSDLVPQQRFFEHVRMEVDSFDVLELLPHWPPVPGVLYHYKKLPTTDGTYLDRLVAMFSPAGEIDRFLIRALFITLFWGGRAGGRPGFLITGPDDDPGRGVGVGKSSLAEAAALLVGGMMDIAAHDDIVTIQKRLFSPPSRTLRLGRIDNLKEMRFSWADFEALLTTATISGYQLRRGEARRPNLLTWVITLNGASLSRDVAKRFVIIKLARPTYQASWRRDLETFITKHRWQIIAEIGAVLEQPGTANELSSGELSRWSDWDLGVLARLPEPAALIKAIGERQNAVDEDGEETDLVRSHFRDEILRATGQDPDTVRVFLPSGVAADWLKGATKGHRPTNRASAYLRSLTIPELRKSKQTGRPGWEWTGKDGANTAVKILGNPPKLPPTTTDKEERA